MNKIKSKFGNNIKCIYEDIKHGFFESSTIFAFNYIKINSVFVIYLCLFSFYIHFKYNK